MAQHHGGAQIDVNHARKFVNSNRLDQPAGMIAGIVDQYIHAAEFELGLLEDVNAGISIGHVHRENFNAGLVAQIFSNSLELLFAPRHEHQVGPGFSKQACRGGTHALRSARDDHGLVIKNHPAILGDVLRNRYSRGLKQKNRAMPGFFCTLDRGLVFDNDLGSFLGHHDDCHGCRITGTRRCF